MQIFHEDTNTITLSAGISKFRFDPDTYEYHFSLSGNTKVGDHVATWSTPMGNYVIENLPAPLTNTKGTCKNCKECKLSCYVRSSYRYPNVIFSQAINAWGLRHALKKVETDLAKQLLKHPKVDTIRLNQSGELENACQMAMWCRLAKKFPERKFYIYTKMYGLVGKFLERGDVPPNFTILFSVWHDMGVEEYKKYSKHPNVKAFVYDDGKDMSLPTKCYCPAYKVIGKTGKAKMDHSVTCGTCRLCIDSKVPVIACHDH